MSLESHDMLREGTLRNLPMQAVPRVSFYDTSPRDGGQNPVTELTSPEKKNAYIDLTKLYQFQSRFRGIELVYAGSSDMDKRTPAFVEGKQSQELWDDVHAFGSSVRKDYTTNPGDEEMMRYMLEAKTKNVTIFVKSDSAQVVSILKTDKETNLAMIRASVQFLRDNGKQVIADMEHFFDGYARDPKYAKQCILAAIEAGAQTVVLCETNGGKMPRDIERIIDSLFSDHEIQEAFSKKKIVLGFHPHADRGQAVESSKDFILHPAIRNYVSEVQIQGNLGQAGERIGNVNLFTLACDLHDMGLDIFAEDEQCWKMMRWTAQQVSKLLTGNFLDAKMPYLGGEAFTHSAGMHVGALHKDEQSYDGSLGDIREKLGAQVRIALSPQSGKGNTGEHLSHFGLTQQEEALLSREIYVALIQYKITKNPTPEQMMDCLNHVVNNSRIHYSDAWAQAAIDFWEITHQQKREALFEVKDFSGHIESRRGTLTTRATVHLENTSGSGEEVWKRESKGILHNLSESLKRELKQQGTAFDTLEDVELVDYYAKATEHGTEAHMRCTVVFRDTKTGEYWSTQAIGQTNDEAGFMAIQDAFRYKLLTSSGAITHHQDSVLMEKYATRAEMEAYVEKQKSL